MRGDGHRILLVLLDGAADRPAAELGGRTPLEAAETPTLDRLATAGISGIADIGPPGVPMPSDRAHARLFGYDPASVPRRGVLEARGLGVDVPDSGVTASANFARIESSSDGSWTVGDRSLSEVRSRCRDDAELVSAFDTDGVTISLEYTWKNRGILRLTADEPLDPGVTDTDPFESGLPITHPEPTVAADDSEAATRTADALATYTRWSIDRLNEGESDAVLSKWAGAPTHPEPFAETQGMSAASLTSKPVLAGLAATLGMDVIDPPEGYDERAAAVLDALESHEFVHAHYPEPDEVAHAETPTDKACEIEAIDASLATLVDHVLDDDLVTVVTADHTTPSERNVVHSGEPVPVTMVAPTARTDGVDRVGERPAAGGGVGRIAGDDLLRIARALGDRVLLDGLRRTPRDGTVPTIDVRPLTGGGMSRDGE
ncbi:MAG: hypothetical protein ACQET5_11200 [Halobacteriota archaeon]|uniref:hypothetical protein n=1 Tax=Natronomonas sp. TaxID=2184060 RepID=UPI0039753484